TTPTGRSPCCRTPSSCRSPPATWCTTSVLTSTSTPSVPSPNAPPRRRGRDVGSGRRRAQGAQPAAHLAVGLVAVGHQRLDLLRRVVLREALAVLHAPAVVLDGLLHEARRGQPLAEVLLERAEPARVDVEPRLVGDRERAEEPETEPERRADDGVDVLGRGDALLGDR